MTAAKPPPERYGIELCLAHRRKAETDGASRIVYEAMAYRYLDAFIVERAAVEKRELALREALEEIQEQRGVLCTSECHASQRMVEIASSALASYRARARSGWREAMTPEDCVRRLRELTDPNTYSGPQSIASTARLAATIIERLAVELAKFEGSDAVRECASLRAELDRAKVNHLAACSNAQQAYTDLENEVKAHLRAAQGEIYALRSQLAARDAELAKLRARADDPA